MILPTKHLQTERSLLFIGGEVLDNLSEPRTVSRLWDGVRERRGYKSKTAPISYDWFILTLDLLFLINAVTFERGLIRKVKT